MYICYVHSVHGMKNQICTTCRDVFLTSRSPFRFDNMQSEISYNNWEAYGQSKLANILFTRELATRLNSTGVTANSLHSGTVMT